MDAPLFLAEFGHIANAPGGVARLQASPFGLGPANLVIGALARLPHAAILCTTSDIFH